MIRRQADRVQRGKHRPGAVDVVGAPAPEPAALRLLLAQQIVDSGLHPRIVHLVAELRQHAESAAPRTQSAVGGSSNAP